MNDADVTDDLLEFVLDFVNASDLSLDAFTLGFMAAEKADEDTLASCRRRPDERSIGDLRRA